MKEQKRERDSDRKGTEGASALSHSHTDEICKLAGLLSMWREPTPSTLGNGD